MTDSLCRGLFLYLPLGLVAAFAMGFVAANAYPLSPLGVLFGRQPGNPSGYAGIGVLMILPFWYLVVYGSLSLWSGCPPWLKVTASIGVALTLAIMTAGAQFARALAGGGGDNGFPMAPVRYLSAIALPRTVELRKWHYVAHLDDDDRLLSTLAASGIYAIADRGEGKGDDLFQRAVAKAIVNPDTDIRTSLMLALEACYPLTDAAVVELTSALGAPDAAIRKDVIELFGTLARYGQQHPAMLPALIEVARTDEDLTVREAAIRAATTMDAEGSRLGQAPPAEREALEKVLLAAIENGEPFGAKGLFELNPEDPRAASACARFMSARDPAVRRTWIASTEGLSVDPAVFDMRAALIRALADEDATTRAAAISMLRAKYYYDADAHTAIALLLTDRDREVRSAAVWALLSFERSQSQARVNEKILWALVGALSDEDRSIRANAASALAQAQPKGVELQLALVSALAKADPGSGRELVAALARANDPAVLEAVGALLSVERVETSILALDLLQEVVDGSPGSSAAERAKNLLGTPPR
jgi:hypothetical protein